MLVHHPYEDFDASAVAFVEQAASDPSVLAIKQTLYRTSGKSSPIIRSLIRAAESGKQVVALVELTARFDEQANISWAQALEQAGVHVIYGIVGLKTHAKVSLVVRNEAGRINRYCHVSTGNYNPVTRAHLRGHRGAELRRRPVRGPHRALQRAVGYSRDVQYRRIVVAPQRLRDAMVRLIHRESRPGGRIVMKMNGLIDSEVIDALYEAADAGAEVDLVVRGMCTLNPAACGAPQRLRVRSLVGRYLEHSRVFRFGAAVGRRLPAQLRRHDAAQPRPPRRDRGARRRRGSCAAGLDEILDLSLDRRHAGVGSSTGRPGAGCRPRSGINAQVGACGGRGPAQPGRWLTASAALRIRVPLELSVPAAPHQGRLPGGEHCRRRAAPASSSTPATAASPLPAASSPSSDAEAGAGVVNTLGHPKLSSREWTAPAGAPRQLVDEWTRAYRRGRPLAGRATVTVHTRRHQVSSSASEPLLTVVEERLDERDRGRTTVPRTRHLEVTDATKAGADAIAVLREAAIDDGADAGAAAPAPGARAPAGRCPAPDAPAPVTCSRAARRWR